MPNSLITRLPLDRRTELLRKLSANSKRLRGRAFPNTNFDATVKGRQDALEAMCKRGIIPVHIMEGAATLHAWAQAYPARRSGPETITIASTFTTGSYSKGFLGGVTAAFVNPNADDATLTGLSPVGVPVDFTATSSLDASATGAARATVN